MESFNDLLHKLREVHEREVDGWQGKVQELSNKKGCDTKRMEELFTRNQQMKEQQRLLTENIKTLENRLRAGLCDRCTVTEEFANREQQGFGASQIQNLQRISQMVAEITNLKKENNRQQDEIMTLRAALDCPGDHSSHKTEVKSSSSPDFSPSSIIEAALKPISLHPDCDVLKSDREQRSDEHEHRQQRAMRRANCETYKPLALPNISQQPWKTDHSAARTGERRPHRMEGLDQRMSLSPQALLLKTSSSSTFGGNRHVLHTPVPCRPQPIRGTPHGLPWPLSESSDWVTAAAASANQVRPSAPKPNVPHFPNLLPTNQHVSSRRQGFGPPWLQNSPPPATTKEPTVVFRFRNLPEYPGSQVKPQEKEEMKPVKAEGASEQLKETCEGPLDLSDRGKSWFNVTPKRNESPLAVQSRERIQKSPDTASSANTPTHIIVSSPSPVSLSSSSSFTSSVKHQDEESTSDHNHKQVTGDQEEKTEMKEKTEKNGEKRVPVLTISLRPVVLETLNSLQKHESLSSKGKSTTSSAVEPGSSSDEQDDKSSMSGHESSQGCKRKRASVETETDRDSDTDNTHNEVSCGEETQQKTVTLRH
ncbi:AF4/FMR2 family member 4 isoform X2 [Cynoglossus semilaevis]|uniref:AF4/FMR2 family member 4 isoform X2 n=1 Tax=Cynoglossus semilaevis TaxID=244447 RepID=UPI0007DCA82F|nr:RBBP8 N-terminal-like protein isoform X2 [Cynoglossus semilaevis]